MAKKQAMASTSDWSVKSTRITGEKTCNKQVCIRGGCVPSAKVAATRCQSLESLCPVGSLSKGGLCSERLPPEGRQNDTCF